MKKILDDDFGSFFDPDEFGDAVELEYLGQKDSGVGIFFSSGQQLTPDVFGMVDEILMPKPAIEFGVGGEIRCVGRVWRVAEPLADNGSVIRYLLTEQHATDSETIDAVDDQVRRIIHQG